MQALPKTWDIYCYKKDMSCLTLQSDNVEYDFCNYSKNKKTNQNTYTIYTVF